VCVLLSLFRARSLSRSLSLSHALYTIMLHAAIYLNASSTVRSILVDRQRARAVISECKTHTYTHRGREGERKREKEREMRGRERGNRAQRLL
jgi:hypothetical protein